MLFCVTYLVWTLITSMVLESLQKYVAFHSRKPSSESLYATYLYVDQKIVPDDTPSVHDAHSPSLQPVAFAIRHMLRPSLIFDQIPDLLDLLTTVETFRKIAVAKAGDALTWNTFYKNRTEQTTVLTDEEEASIQKIVDEDEAMRSIYIKILAWCFELDLYHVYTSSSFDPVILAIRLNEYFPNLHPEQCPPSPRLLYRDPGLSSQEIETLAEMGTDCRRLIKAAYEWKSKHRGSFNEKELYDTPEFQVIYPTPDEKRLVDHIKYYLRFVENYVRTLEDTFELNNALI